MFIFCECILTRLQTHCFVFSLTYFDLNLSFISLVIVVIARYISTVNTQQLYYYCIALSYCLKVFFACNYRKKPIKNKSKQKMKEKSLTSVQNHRKCLKQHTSIYSLLIFIFFTSSMEAKGNFCALWMNSKNITQGHYSRFICMCFSFISGGNDETNKRTNGRDT